MKLNRNLLKATVVGALGGLLFGFDTAVVSGTTHSLTIVYGLTPKTLGLTVSIALWGTVIGAMSAGVIGQKFGAREVLRVLAFLYVVSALGCALAISWPMLVVARFIGGLAIGGSSVLGPVYIAEISPAELRGRLVGMFQINIVIGILLAYLSNYCVARIVAGPNDWRWMFGVAAAPAFLFLTFLFTIPRSPRWLVTQNRVAEARTVLQAIELLTRRRSSARSSHRFISKEFKPRSHSSPGSIAFRFFWLLRSASLISSQESTRSSTT